MASSPKKGKISVASTSKQEEATSSCCSPPRHDVFLSFRGDDTRLNFTAHLHFALKQRGINAYLDDTDLQRGTFIESTLWKAIEESRFSIVVFSKTYASSSWCLDELLKIVRCKEEKGHIPLPVFYDVDPSEVAQQTGNYGKAFVKHELTESPAKVRRWKDSLATVAKLAGWDVRNRNESEIIRVIVEDVSRKLSCTISRTSKDLVGIERRIKQFNGLLDEASNDTHFIGIFGMGGLGKTTLAREVYERIHSEFEAACFLANVREVYVKDGVIRLQEKLLSATLMQKISLPDYYEGIAQIQNRLRYKKVLLILDDVDKREQLEKLAAQRGWFGPGSRIIITSRNKQLLTAHGVTIICEAEKLNDDEALILFSFKAFKQDQPIDSYLELSKCIVSYADGLPLALEVIGLFLHGRNTSQWKSEINKLKESPKKDIFDVLRISFDGLDDMEKEIFLDIACFFKGMKEDRVTRILDSCGFSACIGIGVLIERSLITVSQNELWMHDLLQIMGRKIVEQESPKNASERSRLWKYKDVFDALINSTGRAEVESIFLDLPKQKEATWNMDAFSKWSKLRLIKIHNVQLCQGPEHLSNELRLLEWHAFPSKSLPVSFQPEELVELDMSYSSVEQLWYGFKRLVNLKIINLSHSLDLTSTPDFTGFPNLEKLILEGCKSLFDVHPSFSLHKKLEYVNLVDCVSLRSLPNNLEMESLKVFTLNGCSRFDKFPDIVGNKNCLVKLHLDGTAIEELPSSIQYLSGLAVLGLNSCKNLERLPNCFNGLKSLKKLDVSCCSRLQNLPEDLEKVECLKKLDASGTAIRQLPVSIFLLKNLKVLSFDGCENIVLLFPSLSCLYSLTVLSLSACNLREGILPENIGHLTTLRNLDLSRNKFRSLPKSISQLSRLETLVLEDCRMLQSLPEVPSKIQNVNFNGCTSLKQIPDPIELNGLERTEFKCLNCWELYHRNGCDILGYAMLKRYLKGMTNPRPGFSIAVPGSKIPEWFIHQKEGSSINIAMPPKMDSDQSGWKGIAACVAFSAYRSPSSSENYGKEFLLYCHFKANGREDYPSNMWINWSFIQLLSDHLWLFCLSFDHLPNWQHECMNNIELSFRSCEAGLKVKSCGVRLVPSSAGVFRLSKAKDVLDTLEYNMEDKVVELDMRYSSIQQLWFGLKSLVNLKIIDLSHSLNLTITPVLSATPNLEKLILEGCRSLYEVHPSIGLPKKLEYINFVDCESLRILPNYLEMESLEVCTLNGCSRLEKFPKGLKTKSLLELYLDGTSVKELSNSLLFLPSLVILSLNNCKTLERLPSSMRSLKSLRKLHLSGCSRLQNLPEDLGEMECLEELDVSGTAITPVSISLLKNLRVLSFGGCKEIDSLLHSLSCMYYLKILNLSACHLREGELLKSIGNLWTLRGLDLSRNDFCSLPKSIMHLFGLKTLSLEECKMLQSLPQVPSNIRNVNLNGCASLIQIPDPSMLSGLGRSEFQCLNCRKLSSGDNNYMWFNELKNYIQGMSNDSNPRPGFSITVPGFEIPCWFSQQEVGSSSIKVLVPRYSGCKGFAACVAFSTNKFPSSLKDSGMPHIFCRFKTNGRDYPSDMSITWNFVDIMVDHLWLFCLSFDHLWRHDFFNNIEFSFHSCGPEVYVKSCGVHRLYF